MAELDIYTDAIEDSGGLPLVIWMEPSWLQEGGARECRRGPYVEVMWEEDAELLQYT